MITDAVRGAEQMSVAELAAATGASEMTIRRDLDVLSEQGVLERFRGGARSLLLRGEGPPFALRKQDGIEAKQRIAAEVARLIAEGESVVIDSGTTCVEVANALRNHRITVMPLSLHAANALAGGPRLTLLMPGGEVRTGELTMTGPLAQTSLAALRFDTAILGCCGLSAADGLTAYDLPDAAVKRAAIASARRTIVVTDGSKFTRTALATVAPASSLDVVVTDETAPAAQLEALAAAGTTVWQVRAVGITFTRARIVEDRPDCGLARVTPTPLPPVRALSACLFVGLAVSSSICAGPLRRPRILLSDRARQAGTGRLRLVYQDPGRRTGQDPVRRRPRGERPRSAGLRNAGPPVHRRRHPRAATRHAKRPRRLNAFGRSLTLAEPNQPRSAATWRQA